MEITEEFVQRINVALEGVPTEDRALFVKSLQNFFELCAKYPALKDVWYETMVKSIFKALM